MTRARLRASEPADLGGQVALVTGGARGIGEACALALAREGADVAVADLLPAESVVTAIGKRGRRALGVVCDVTVGADVRRAVTRAVSELGRLDVLVTSAGIVHREGLEETAEATWDRVVDVVLKGTFLAIQAVVPVMRAQGYGKIVTIASISGLIGGAVSRAGEAADAKQGRSGPAYAAAKGGVIALTLQLVVEGGPHGIRANVISPGLVETPNTAPMLADPPERMRRVVLDRIPLGRHGRPDDVVNAAVFLASDESSWVSGANIVVDGGGSVLG